MQLSVINLTKLLVAITLAACLLPSAGVAPTARAFSLPPSAHQPTDATTTAQQDKDTPVLEQGKPIERELTTGDAHLYRISLTAGQFLRVAIDPQGIDVVVALSGPDGTKLMEVDPQSGTQAAGSVSFVAEAAGVYQLQVRPAEAGAAAGRYEVKIEALRAATPQDKSRIAAERSFAEAVQLQYERGTVESLRMAVRKYEEALALWQAAGERGEQTRTLGSIGVAYSALGEYQKAIDYYDKQRELVRRAGDRRKEASLLENIGWLYYNSLGNKQRALDYLNPALELYRDAGNRAAEARTLTIIGKVYNNLGENLGEKQQALSYYTKVLTIYHEAKDSYAEGDALTNLMFAWKALEKSRPAIFYGKQAVNVFQRIRVSIKELEKDTQKTFLNSKEHTYRTLAELLISEGRLPEAQQVLGLLKEEEYFQFVRRNDSEAAGLTARASATAEEAELDKRYHAIADQVTTRGRQRSELIAKSSRSAAEEQMLLKIEADLDVAGQAFQKFLNGLADEFGNTKQAAKVDYLRESQALMDDLRELGAGSVALYTIVGEEKYRVILITPDVQKAAEYPIKAAELYHKVATFREALQDYTSDPRPLAQELHKILVGPIAKDLRDAGAETLMWSLDSVLRYVPMAALHDGEKYLVERYRNVVFTPASNSRLKDQPSAKWKGLGFGVSKAHAGFSPLPAVPEELRGIFREESADQSGGGVLTGKVILDEGFTEEAMKAVLRQRFPVVHIASHFSFQPGNETSSFLLLGDGKQLTLAQIKTSMNLFSGVELLTLSACDTATGGAGADGKEVEGFAVLAQRQGAKAVMATLWPVADASTRQLMQEFYRIRDAQAGTLKVEALRQAQLALLRGEEKAPGASEQKRISYAHPYFWAPFILIGNWR